MHRHADEGIWEYAGNVCLVTDAEINANNQKKYAYKKASALHLISVSTLWHATEPLHPLTRFRSTFLGSRSYYLHHITISSWRWGDMWYHVGIRDPAIIGSFCPHAPSSGLGFIPLFLIFFSSCFMSMCNPMGYDSFIPLCLHWSTCEKCKYMNPSDIITSPDYVQIFTRTTSQKR